LTAVVSTVAIGLWIAVAVLYKKDDFNPEEKWDMLSFTCGHRHDADLDRAIGNLGSLCIQMRYSWWAALVVAVLEITAVVTLVWGYFVLKQGGAYTKLNAGAGDEK
jgi:hypothetical protein